MIKLFFLLFLWFFISPHSSSQEELDAAKHFVMSAKGKIRVLHDYWIYTHWERWEDENPFIVHFVIARKVDYQAIKKYGNPWQDYHDAIVSTPTHKSTHWITHNFNNNKESVIYHHVILHRPMCGTYYLRDWKALCKAGGIPKGKTSEKLRFQESDFKIPEQ